jgi:hypothetical protein
MVRHRERTVDSLPIYSGWILSKALRKLKLGQALFPGLLNVCIQDQGMKPVH